MTNWTYLKDRCEEWERRQCYIHAFLAADAASPHLKIKTMLSTVATKVGPPKEVLAWSLPLAKTCCVHDESGESIASPVCRAVCYVHRMAADRPNVIRKLDAYAREEVESRLEWLDGWQSEAFDLDEAKKDFDL